MTDNISHPQEYLVYTRRSTDDLINQKNSIEYQTKQCLAFAQAQGLVVAGISIEGFCEKGVVQERHTAFKTAALDIGRDGTVKYRIERPKFQRLVSLLAERKLRGVVCLCWDRLSRNPHDDAIIKDLKARGVDVRFVEATYDNSSSGALHMDIDGMFAAHYSRVSSEKIRAANAKLRAEGKWPGRTPIGYLDQGPDNKPLDPDRAPIIRRMFELYATGEWSMSQLAKWAREQGLMTKPQRPHRTAEEILAGTDSASKPVSYPIKEKTIECMLHNSFYTGMIRHGGIDIPGSHEPLITKNLFQRVQRMLNQRNTSVHYVDKQFFVYRGFVKCACRRSYSPYEKKGFRYYWTPCRDGCLNSRANLREDYIDHLFEALLGRVYLSEKEIAHIKDRAPQALRRRSDKRADKQKELEQQKVRAQRDLGYLEENKITLLREGAYTASAYAEEARRLEDELAGLDSQKVVAESVDGRQMLDTVLEFSELVRLAKTNYKNTLPDEKHHLLSISVSELVVIDGFLANFSAKAGFAAMLKRPVGGFSGPNYVFSELEGIYTEIFKATSQIIPLLASSK